VPQASGVVVNVWAIFAQPLFLRPGQGAYAGL